ncbi:MAG: XdhC family protein [Marinomonas sp.]
MSNQLTAMLQAWQKGQDEADWVLGTVYKTQGSCYRKAGALTLINSRGEQYGLLSGGCLEADIVRNARKVLQWGNPLLLSYDATDEDDWSYQLGIGCGGKVYIMLQAITKENDLGLSAMVTALENRQPGLYHQKINANEGYFEPLAEKSFQKVAIQSRNGESSNAEKPIEENWLVQPIVPEPHLLIVGGGVDAKPLVNMAKEMGWKITLADPRASHARAKNFPNADVILDDVGEPLSEYLLNQGVDAMVIMSHSMEIDAKALNSAQVKAIDYVTMLGPKHRFQEVLGIAKLKPSQLVSKVASPAGFDIGGQLPESIALSILAQCHSVLHHSSVSQSEQNEETRIAS